MASAPGSDVDVEIEIDWLGDLPSLLRFGREWDKRLDAWGCRLPFLRWDWVRSWMRVYGRGPGGDPVIYRVAIGRSRSDGHVIGIAPLVLVLRRAVPLGPQVRILRLIGAGPLCPDHLILPCEPGMERRFAAALHAALDATRDRWDRIELHDLLRPQDDTAGRDSVAASLLQAARASGTTVLDRERTTCPYAKLPATWEEYLAGLSRKMRSNVKLGWRKLEEAFRVEVVSPDSIAEVDRAIDVLIDLHNRAWSERGRVGAFEDPRFRLFHRLHARRAFRSGTLRLLTLTCDGKPAAAILCFAGERTIHYYQLGHDPEARAYGAGTLIVLAAIQRAIEEGSGEFDFLRGSDPYKSRLAPEERRGWDLVYRSDNIADRTEAAALWTRRSAGSIARGVLGKRGARWVKSRLRMR